jgi:glutathione reductase (NADPH)
MEAIYTHLKKMAPIKKEYDYVVIGGGSGGMAAARRAASYGAKVAIIEAHSVLGGTCVNVGCVPKKIMWNTGKMSLLINASYIFIFIIASVNEMLKQAGGYGYSVSEYKFDWNTVKTKRDAYIKKLNGIYENNMQREKVDHFHGHAGFKDAKTVVVTAEGAEPIELSGKKILIATGSHSIIPNVPGKELGIDSDGFFQLEHQPKRVAVVGTGYIAVELAGVFHALGSEVTVFSRTKFILRKFDDIIKNNLLTEMQSVGVNFVFDSGVKGLRLKDENDKSGPIIVEYESNGEKGELEADTVLWAIGRVPRTEGLNLEAAGVQVDQRGHIVVDEYQNTNVENICSLGDVIGKAELTPGRLNTSYCSFNDLFISYSCRCCWSQVEQQIIWRRAIQGRQAGL